ncbi:DUF4175 family protein [Pontibacter silvestris]|uniref:DUF4175 family protein n=1 Tax=Pontibacter silvestris TaxID=2305183 RepID=A0ABW4X160_9BACT|nr:LapA family protein [Pontibacter silvestris]MCC9135794.1 DUF4175 domain-containing protein [Pontibacter silvestris]
MATQESIYTLRRIRQKYVQEKGLLYAQQALAAALVGGAILLKWKFEIPVLAIVALSIVLGAVIYFVFALSQVMKTTLRQVARHLNRNYPQLEDSTELLLQPQEELNLLQRLQQQKVIQALQAIHPEKEKVFSLSSTYTRAALGLALVISAGILYLPAAPLKAFSAPKEVKVTFPDAPETDTDTAASIQKIEITVTPPAYTAKQAYRAEQPNIRVEEGATVNWHVTTNKPATKLQLVLNDASSYLNFKKTNKSYSLSQSFTAPTLYHINLNGQKSAYYTIEIIPDEVPAIRVDKPKQYTEILFGDPQRVVLQGQLSDDYGIRDANLIATVAKGSGEAVKFSEAKLDLGINFSNRQRSHQLNKAIDLQKLGMTYGDELYFYIQAWDNHRGYTRSEIYLVQIEDTTIVEAAFDMSMGVNPVPEYFRSQRQIIIDTEKLIAEQKNLTQAVFEERSNTIGIDQKLLRLRYGKFLGEEAESGIGPGGGIPEGEKGHEEHSADDGHNHQEFENQSSPEALLDPYMHKHDQEGEATIFDPEVKTKLQGSLAQMWEAELRLRTNRPKEALPFEYKALRLLKEVQQSTRAYVAKTGFEAPPLKEPELRLTGELDKITPPSDKSTIKEEERLPNTRAALQWLEHQKQNRRYSQTDAQLLERAGQELAKQALATPGRYLHAMQDLRTLIADMNSQKPLCQPCLLTVERAWQELLPLARQTAQKQASVRSRLSREYMERLNR